MRKPSESASYIDVNTEERTGSPESVLFSGAVDIVPKEELSRRMKGDDALRVKFGMDPTAPDIHIGHSVALRKLRQFQDLGHTAVLVIGDYTALVGDPSGRSKTRPLLTPEEIEENTRTYLDQAYLVLDPARTEVRHNAEWLSPLDMADIIRLTRTTTVARILERDDFRKRFAANESISLTELLYPMMQAYDSVAIDADVELGGTDQLYNLLMGRHVMDAYGMTPQCVLTMPLLVGTDGRQKMSKSLGNYIGMTDSANDIFGKTMSIPDALMDDYFALLLGEPLPEGEAVQQKRTLARRLVELLQPGSSSSAEAHFDTVTSRGVPEDVPEVKVGEGEVWIIDLITRAGFAATNGEARRFVKGGAVRLDGETVSDEKARLGADSLDGKVLQVGKRRYARISAR